MAQSDASWTVITGSTGGIGSEIAKLLAMRGASMILINRSEEKAKLLRSKILEEHSDLQIELITADLMDVSQIVAATELIKALPGKIDTLYNNSGVLTSEKILSKQGFESHFAVNTLAPYLLIHHLRAKMARASSESPAMIINFSSSAISKLKKLDMASLSNPEKVGGLMTTYAQTKLAVTALAPALAEDLKNDHILIRAIDPGPTKSAMTTGGNSGMPKLLRWVAPLLFRPADQQALKIVHSADAAAFEGRSGIYISNNKVKKMPVSIASVDIQRELISFLDKLIEDS